MTTTYTTRDEAIQREIVAAIEASGEVADAWAEFDIDAIAEEVLGDYADGYELKVDLDEFWRVVERHAHPRVLVGGEAVDTSDAAAIAQVISRAIPDAAEPVYAEEVGEWLGALETDWAVRVGEARLIIGPDEYTAGVAWVIYRDAVNQDAGEVYAHGGWAVSDDETARREIAVIIDTLTRLGAEE